MLARRNLLRQKKNLANGPGKVAQAMGISCEQTGLCLGESKRSPYAVWIEKGIEIPKKKIEITPRIGIDYAEEDKEKPWRFLISSENILL